MLCLWISSAKSNSPIYEDEEESRYKQAKGLLLFGKENLCSAECLINSNFNSVLSQSNTAKKHFCSLPDLSTRMESQMRRNPSMSDPQVLCVSWRFNNISTGFFSLIKSWTFPLNCFNLTLTYSKIRWTRLANRKRKLAYACYFLSYNYYIHDQHLNFMKPRVWNDEQMTVRATNKLSANRMKETWCLTRRISNDFTIEFVQMKMFLEAFDKYLFITDGVSKSASKKFQRFINQFK